MLLRLGTHAQKKTLKDDERESERVKALRAAWPEPLAGVPPEDLVFVDESGVNLAMTRPYARSRARSPRLRQCAAQLGREREHPGARWACVGPLASRYLPGATDGPVFLTYLKKVLVPRNFGAGRS